MTHRLFVIDRLVAVGPSRQWFSVHDKGTDERWLAAVHSESVEDSVMLTDEVRVWANALTPKHTLCPVDVVRLGGRWCQLYPDVVLMPTAALGVMPASVAVHVVTRAAQIWLHLHQGTNDAGRAQQLAHGNLHPNNLFIDQDGEVIVGDPDLSLRRSGAWDDQHPVPIPEPRGRIEGDVYALGSLLWNWLGEHRRTPHLVGMLRRAMSTNPAQRPNLSQLASALSTLQGRVEGPDPQPWLKRRFQQVKPPKKPGFLRLTVGLGYPESPDYADERDLEMDIGVSMQPTRARKPWPIGLTMLLGAVAVPFLLLMGSGLFSRFIGADLQRAVAEEAALEQQLWGKLTTTGARSFVIRSKGDIAQWDQAIEQRSLPGLLQIMGSIQARQSVSAKGREPSKASLLGTTKRLGDRYLVLAGDVDRICGQGATSLLASFGLLACPERAAKTTTQEPKD